MPLQPFRKLTDRLDTIRELMEETGKQRLPIEKGVPIPAQYTNNWVLFDWRQMQIGDSVLIPVAKSVGAYEKKVLSTKVGAMVAYIHKSKENRRRPFPMRFLKRTVDDGIRVWRVR